MPHFTVNFGSQRDPANNFSGRVRTKEAWATAGKANALHFPASDSRSNNSGLNVAQDLAADELVASENHSRIRRQKLLSHKLVMGMSQYQGGIESTNLPKHKVSGCSQDFPSELMDVAPDARPGMRIQSFKKSWRAPKGALLGTAPDLMASSKDLLLCNMLNDREWVTDKNSVELGRRNMYAAITSLRREKQKMTMNGWVDCAVPGQHWRRIIEGPGGAKRAPKAKKIA
jgi:hypothetical protein